MDTQRPQLQAMLEYTREGDVIHVHSIDRLARNLKDLSQLVEDLNIRGISIYFHKENLTFKNDQEIKWGFVGFPPSPFLCAGNSQRVFSVVAYKVR